MLKTKPTVQSCTTAPLRKAEGWAVKPLATKHPAWCCQICGEAIGLLGRAFGRVLHSC